MTYHPGYTQEEIDAIRKKALDRVVAARLRRKTLKWHRRIDRFADWITRR